MNFLLPCVARGNPRSRPKLKSWYERRGHPFAIFHQRNSSQVSYNPTTTVISRLMNDYFITLRKLKKEERVRQIKRPTYTNGRELVQIGIKVFHREKVLVRKN